VANVFSKDAPSILKKPVAILFDSLSYLNVKARLIQFKRALF